MKNTVDFLIFMCINIAVVLGDCVYNTQTESHPAEGKIAPLVGHRWSADDDKNDEKYYQYTVAICGSAKPEDPNFKYAGVLQTEIIKNVPGVPVNIGDIRYAAIKGGNDWVYLEYRNGTHYPHSCNHQERRAHIMLICDKSATQGSLKIIEENKNLTADCYYLLELSHAVLCSLDSSASGLSSGSVICIVFITVVGLYLIGGFIYQRLVVGAKGWEQLPNYSFWQDFGNLQADGCDFICRTRSKSASREYRGIGDDQLHDEDAGRDDNLLPM